MTEWPILNATLISKFCKSRSHIIDIPLNPNDIPNKITTRRPVAMCVDLSGLNSSTSAPWRHLGGSEMQDYSCLTKILPGTSIDLGRFFFTENDLSEKTYQKKAPKTIYPFLQTKKLGCYWGSHRHVGQWSASLYVVSRKRARRILVCRVFWKKTSGTSTCS